MFHLKRELAKARRSTSIKGEDSESSNGVMVQASSTPDLRNGKDDSSVLEEEDEEEEEEGESTLIFMERQGGSPTSSQRGNSSKENDHVTKKEAEAVLRILGVELPGNSPRVELPGNSSTVSNGFPSQVQHTGSQTELDRNCLSDILMKELATAKNKCTEMSSEVERKRRDLKQALQREAAILRELQIAKDCIVSLEDKITDIQAERQQCSECSSKLSAIKNNSTNPNSAEKLLSNLRATWSQSTSSSRKRNVKEEWI